ncbi:hypothetical protein [Radicibacter daui]|uniref:hypothetical protein n=1 Tax=Radicibacter daui TaxID=3064829 RepID=UPI004046C0B2
MSVDPIGVYGLLSGISWKAPVDVATVGPIFLSGVQDIDGVTGTENQSVLVWRQEDPLENGIYWQQPGMWVRRTDADGPRDFTTGSRFVCLGGAANGNRQFKVTTATLPVAPGINPLNFAVDQINWGGKTSVKDVATLRLNTEMAANIFVQGYYEIGDGGGGQFSLDPADVTSADNGVTVIVDAMGNRWKRELNGTVLSVLHAGARNDGSVDAVGAFAAALATGVTQLHIPAGTYRFDSTLIIGAVGSAWPMLTGEGMRSTFIDATSHTGPAVHFNQTKGSGGGYGGGLADLSILGSNGVKLLDRTQTLTAGGILPFNMLFQRVAVRMVGVTSPGIAFDFAKLARSRVEDCNADAPNVGLLLVGCEDNAITGFTVRGFSGYAIYERSCGTLGRQNRFSGCNLIANEDASATYFKAASQSVIMASSYIRTSPCSSVFDFSHVDEPDWFGENLPASPSFIDLAGVEAVIGSNASDFAYRVDVSEARYIRIEPVRMPGGSDVLAIFTDASGIPYETGIPAIVGSDYREIILGDINEAFGSQWQAYRSGSSIAYQGGLCFTTGTLAALPMSFQNDQALVDGIRLNLPAELDTSATVQFIAPASNPSAVYLAPGTTYTLEVYARTRSPDGDTLNASLSWFETAWSGSSPQALSLSDSVQKFTFTATTPAVPFANEGVRFSRGTNNGVIEIYQVRILYS